MNIHQLLDIFKCIIIVTISFYFFIAKLKHNLKNFSQYKFFIISFILFSLSAILDVLDNYEYFYFLFFIKNTALEIFLEKFIGELGGFIFLLIGFKNFIPYITKILDESEGKDIILKFFELSNNGILIITEENTIINCNLSASKILGYDKNYLISKKSIVFSEYKIKKFKEDHKIKVVFLDLIMPGISSKEVYKNLIKISPTVEIILFSGFIKDERAVELQKMGIKYTLSKPFGIEQLQNILQEIF